MFDERAVLHRYKSTSHAGVACGVMVVGWFAYQYYVKDVFRTDLLMIGAVTALIKVGSLLWYRWRD
jgi:hypothetical protein